MMERLCTRALSYFLTAPASKSILVARRLRSHIARSLGRSQPAEAVEAEAVGIIVGRITKCHEIIERAWRLLV